MGVVAQCAVLWLSLRHSVIRSCWHLQYPIPDDWVDAESLHENCVWYWLSCLLVYHKLQSKWLGFCVTVPSIVFHVLYLILVLLCYCITDSTVLSGNVTLLHCYTCTSISILISFYWLVCFILLFFLLNRCYLATHNAREIPFFILSLPSYKKKRMRIFYLSFLVDA